MARYADLIKNKRREEGLTQKQFAAKYGTSRGYIALVESDKAKPGRKLLEKLGLLSVAEPTIELPLLNLEASAGAGRIVYYPRKESLHIQDLLFRKATGVPVAKKTHCIATVRGESMEKTIPDDSLVVLDTAETETNVQQIDGKIFFFWQNGELLCKRLKLVDDGVKVISDNPTYVSFIIPKNEFDDRCKVFAKVVGIFSATRLF